MKYIKIYDDFNIKSITDEIKYISSIILKDLIKNGNNSFYKKYEFGSYIFTLDIKYKKKDKEPYESRINLYDILFNNNVENITIPIIVNDESIDFNYLISVISHEIRHIYDIFTINNEYEGEEFVKELTLNKYKKTNYYNFTYLIYISLEHELIARNNMLYTYLRWRNINKTDLIKLYEDSYINKSLNLLNNFNTVDFVNNFKGNLLKITNDFITDFAKNENICNNDNLVEYYKKWEKFFKLKYNEYNIEANNTIDEIINDVEKNLFEDNQGFRERTKLKDIFLQFYAKYI